MGKECGAWVSRRLWGGGNTSPLKTTAWEATVQLASVRVKKKREKQTNKQNETEQNQKTRIFWQVTKRENYGMMTNSENIEEQQLNVYLV